MSHKNQLNESESESEHEHEEGLKLDDFGDTVCVEVEHSHTPEAEHDHNSSLVGTRVAYTPDSVYTSVDGLRAIAVFFMIVKNVVGRFTSMSNPLAKALGADWIPPVFVFAAGARLVAEQEKLKSSLASVRKGSSSYRRFKAEAYLKQYIKLILIFIFATLYLIASFGPSRVCQWDILNTIATTTALLFPVNLHLNKNHWILLIPAVLLLLFCPVFFDLAHGSSYYGSDGYSPNWSVASIFGSLFLFGPTPVIPYLPFAFVGMVMAHYMMEDKQATQRRRALCGFISMFVIMIGVELEYFGDQRDYTNYIVKRYIFPDYSAAPLSLSWSLILIGVFGMEFAMLSILFDPLGPDVAGPSSPQLTDSFVVRDFFGRCSKWTMSMYLWHAVVINAGLRIAGYVEESEADTYLFYKSVWPLSLWSGNITLFILGLVYFVIVYALFILWEKKGRGIGTFEWMLGLGARGIWAIFGDACCCFARVAYETD